MEWGLEFHTGTHPSTSNSFYVQMAHPAPLINTIIAHVFYTTWLYENSIYSETSLQNIDHFISTLRGNQFTLENVVDCPRLSCMYLHDYVMLMSSKESETIKKCDISLHCCSNTLHAIHQQFILYVHTCHIHS